MRHVPSPDIPANVLSKDWGYHAVYPILKLILFFSGKTANLIQEGWPIQWHPPFLDSLYRITCFAFYILFCKGLEMMGSDKICTTSCIYVHVLSLCHCYALLVTWRIWMRTLGGVQTWFENRKIKKSKVMGLVMILNFDIFWSSRKFDFLVTDAPTFWAASVTKKSN
jgi:hypothetical protein